VAAYIALASAVMAAAGAGWARENGIERDVHQLRAWGLTD